MKLRLTLFSLLCATQTLVAQPLPTERIPIDGLAATVNHRVITVGEVMSALRPIERQLRLRYSGPELRVQWQDAYDRILQALIDQALILEAWEERETPIPDQFVEDRILTLIAEQFGGDRGALLEALQRQGLTMDEWREQIRDNIAIESLRAEIVAPYVMVSPRQVRDAYEARIEEFEQPGLTQARIITIPRRGEQAVEEPRVLAEQVLAEAREGADFAELARTYSTDRYAADGGLRGEVQPDDFRAELATPLMELPPGTISEVIETPENFFIVLVDSRSEAGVTPFDEVRDQLTTEVRAEEEDRIYRAWMNRLRNRHHVQRYALPDDELLR
jgi:peptidyl-prolyl cis-trans isomerase SurA